MVATNYINNDETPVFVELMDLLAVVAKFSVEDSDDMQPRLIVHLDPEKTTKRWPLAEQRINAIGSLLTLLNEELIAFGTTPLDGFHTVLAGGTPIERAVETFKADPEQNSPWHIEIALPSDDLDKLETYAQTHNEFLEFAQIGTKHILN